MFALKKAGAGNVPDIVEEFVIGLVRWCFVFKGTLTGSDITPSLIIRKVDM